MFRAKLVYIHSQTPNYVRVSKNLATFASLFSAVHYIGCSRGAGWASSAKPPNVTYHMYPRDLPLGPRSIFGLPGFFRFVKDRLGVLAPDVVVATNEEAILPFTIGYLPRPRVLVCDLLDSLAIRTTGRLRHLWPLWRALSELALRDMDGLIEVTEERLARHRVVPRHTAVVYNAPTWQDYEPEEGIPRGAVFVSGSISDGVSGLETLISAVERIPGLRIVFAGRPSGTWVKSTFLSHPRVLNLGEVSPARALRIAKGSLALFAHYRPVNLNCVYAAPNKLFDAMMLGIPLLLNRECLVSAMAEREGFGVLTRYGDAQELEAALRGLLAKPSSVSDRFATAKQLFRQRYAWDHMGARYAELFRRLSVPE
jgi:glycosyltransferase involved in cell wall biosynthesis